MQTPRRLLLAALPGLALLAPLPSAPAYAERPAQIDATRTQPLLLQWRYTRGQSATYGITADVAVEDLRQSDTVTSSASVALSLRSEVQSVDAQGTASLALSLGDPTVSLVSPRRDDAPSVVSAALRGARVNFSARPDGTVQERTGLPGSDRTHPNPSAWVSDLIALAWVQFPGEQVRVGDSWVQILPMSQDSGTDGRVAASFTVEYTFTGYALHAGREHIVIDARYSAAVDGNVPFAGTTDQTATLVGRGDGEGYLLFDAAAGSLSEIGLRLGFVLTQTDPTGLRTSRAVTSNATLARAASVDVTGGN